MLAPLVSLWVPNAFVVSFKLETDENLLIVKSRDALNKYKHKVNEHFDSVLNMIVDCFFSFLNHCSQLVIANMLQTRKSRVIFVTPTTSYEISLSKDQLLGGIEIEEHIVAEVVC